MFWERDSTPINQNINTILQKTQKQKKVETTCRESLTPQRTSTYERPFTREGNYLVSIVKAHTIKCQIYPDDVFYAKDLLPARVTI